MSPAIHQATGLVLGSVFVDGDFTLDSVTNLAFALDATTGAIVWTKSLGAGSIPTGFVGSSPVVGSNAAYFFNPLNSLSSALNLADGVVQWETTLANPAPEKYSWGSGVIVSGGTKLVQPVGADLVTIDVATGVVLKTYPVGGSFTYNYATVAGTTYYIGNGWGWVFALPLGTVTGDLADNL